MRGEISKNVCNPTRLRSTNTLAVFLTNESGATAIEYALIGSIVGLGIITGVSQVGTSINNFFMGSGSWFTTAEGGGE
jgi:pilus assembly protein Flp/PilA